VRAKVGRISVAGKMGLVGGLLKKVFMCHNLGADQSADPFTPSWQLNGHYYQWGRTAVAASGPTGASVEESNDGDIAGWNYMDARNSAWTDAGKTANDPCPFGFRVPTRAQWDAVVDISLNTVNYVGTDWTPGPTNYSNGLRIGTGYSGLFLPAAGGRAGNNGTLYYRGSLGYYWSSTEYGGDAWLLSFGSGSFSTTGTSRPFGMSIRCVAE
jgi:uncharacterized protein (TIGR02145 family)